MDGKLMAKLGIRPILKKKKHQGVCDVRLLVSTTLDKRMSDYRSRIVFNLSATAYEKAFGYDFVSFGYAKEAGRLYFWRSTATEGFKLSHKASANDNNRACYVVQSTDMYEALKDDLNDFTNHEYTLKFSKDLGYWYIDILYPDKEY